jgi:hypothetical protein
MPALAGYMEKPPYIGGFSFNIITKFAIEAKLTNLAPVLAPTMTVSGNINWKCSRGSS